MNNHDLHDNFSIIFDSILMQLFSKPQILDFSKLKDLVNDNFKINNKRAMMGMESLT